MNYEYPPIGGGGGRVSEDLARELTRRGHTIRVLTSHVTGLPLHEVRDGYEICRTRVLRSRRDRCTIPEMAAFIGLGAGRAIHDALYWKPDIIHVHFAVPTGALAWMANRLSGVPYVLTAHLGDVPGGVPEQTDKIFRLVKPFTKPIWRSAAAITAVSEFTRRLAVQSYGLPVETVFNGVDLEKVHANTRVRGEAVRLLFAGRFTIQKNLIFMIDLLNRVRDLPWKMELLGDGPLRNELEKRIAYYQLGDRIQLSGWVSPERVEQSMFESDILLLTSLSEGLSVVGIRALASGLAILASDIGGNFDLVEPGGNGFLCPVNDLAVFEQRLRQMISDRLKLTDLKRASRSRSKNFDLNRIVQRYEELFTKVVGGSVHRTIKTAA